MDDFIKYLFVTDQLGEVFFGKEKEQEELVLKRTLDNDKNKQKNINKIPIHPQNN